MMSEFVHQTQEFTLGREEGEEEHRRKRMKLTEVVHSSQLSLGLSPSTNSVESTNSSSSESEVNPQNGKRKYSWYNLNNSISTVQTSVELQTIRPPPLDWEQCLDLQSGKIYYLNRKTLRKSWSWPKGHDQLDLNLNISTQESSFKLADGMKDTPNSNGNMFAVACHKCHLLVMLCKTSPSCPSCKHLHYFPTTQQPINPNSGAVKPLKTLSLLH